MCVNVPVLSVQITWQHPNVSTEGNFRINAFRLIMRCTPIAKVIVTTAGNPSGTAATAKLIAAKSIINIGSPRKTPAPNTTAQTTNTATPRTFPK